MKWLYLRAVNQLCQAIFTALSFLAFPAMCLKTRSLQIALRNIYNVHCETSPTLWKMSLNETVDMAFFEGRDFTSFEELSTEISEYEKRFFVNLYVRSSGTVESAKRRAPNKVFCEDLKFSELDFSCKKEGRKIASKSKGIRPNQR